jgi:hypothetical protein
MVAGRATVRVVPRGVHLSPMGQLHGRPPGPPPEAFTSGPGRPPGQGGGDPCGRPVRLPTGCGCPAWDAVWGTVWQNCEPPIIAQLDTNRYSVLLDKAR